MNVGVFNKVNFKGSRGSLGGEMYAEWSSLPLDGGGRGVLGAVGGAGGRDVVLAVVRQLAQQPEPSPLTSDAEVEWVLEVIRYGLCLPLSEHEALRDCVRVCCAWLAPLLPAEQRPPPAHPPPPACPAPVAAAPRRYARIILRHLHNLFVPRPNETGDLINKQAVLCHRVLRLTRSLAGSAELGASEWRSLLLLLLSAAAALLSPPAAPHSSAEQLCERVLCVLFQVWILACHRRVHMCRSLAGSAELGASEWRSLLLLLLSAAAALLSLPAAPHSSGEQLCERVLCVLFQVWILACHRRVHMCRSLAGSAELGASEWRSLLLLLLSAAAALLSPLAALQSSAEQLCERVLCVLFQVWILACHRCFPSPPLWRTLREQCMSWRHRAALTEQWTRASLCLTARLLQHMYGPLFPVVPICEEDASLVPAEMSGEAVAQTWYRMLHTMGNPVDLCRPHVISHTAEFLQYAITQEEGARDPSQHPCLLALPYIFHKAMKGLAAHVDAFLGLSVPGWWEGGATAGERETEVEGEATPPAHRRLAKSFSVSSGKPRDKPDSQHRGVQRASLMGLNSRPVSIAPTTPPNSIVSQGSDAEKLPLAPLRPKVNSIFHLFGEWLFEAALIGTAPPQPSQLRAEGTPPPPSLSELPHKLHIQSYQPGRAEALGALCRVLCSKQCREGVQAAYLARCYAAIHRGLRDPATAAAVVLNAHDLFRLDLDGVLVLVPDFLSALERILPEREPRLECAEVDKRELRRAAIDALLSLVAVPHHFKGLAVPELPGCTDFAGATFGDLATRISLLCAGAVQVEWVGSLAAPLLSALYLCVRHAPADTGDAGSLPRAPSHHNSARSDGAGDALHVSLDDFSGADAAIRELDPATPMFGAALVVRATYLVCHRLISSWKGDLQVSLAALELLAGLAKLHSSRPDALERKRAVRWICDYISLQCSRPPQAHSRDLHSCVVAAYSCLAAWLCPLPADPDCLATLMELVELGTSGSKSRGKPGEPPKMKDEKELKPVSMRVRDAAESLLMLIMEQVDVSEGGSGVWSRLDERWLAARGHGRPRHYLVDDSLLLSLLEEPLANSQEPQPTLIAIIRGGFGRYAWSLCLRGAARCAGRGGGGACARPVDIQDSPRAVDPVCVPLAHGPPCAVDAAFPTLDAVLRQLGDPEAPALFKLLERQAHVEREVREREDKEIPEEYTPPEPVTEFQTARLFLSHFGYLSIGGDKKGLAGRLVALDGEAEGFARALRRVDSAGARAVVTAHVFCCRAGQRGAREIVANTRSVRTVTGDFLDMLRGLGWPVRVRGHPGWTGHVDTSYDALPDGAESASPPPPPSAADEHGGSLYDGREQVLYWADATSEIAFVVPTDREVEREAPSDVDGACASREPDGRAADSCWDVSGAGGSGNPSYDRSISESQSNVSDRSATSKGHLNDKTRTMSLELDKTNTAFTVSGSGRRHRQYTTKILIIWLEDFEDHLHLPIDALLQYTETGEAWRRGEACVVCASRLRCGLVRVRVAPPPPGAPAGALLAGPLVDGAVLAPHLLPECLRHTALNIARRRRLHDDLYQPPHARRRHLVQELAQRYRLELSEPELLESLFRSRAAAAT